MTAVVVGLVLAVVVLAVLVAGLLRAHAEVLRALHQMGVELRPGPRHEQDAPGPIRVPPPGVRPTPGRPAATDVIDLAGTTPSGDAVSLAVTGVAHDTLVAFLSSGCATCRGFWDAFREGPPAVPGGARLVVVTRGSDAESPGVLASLAGAVPVVMSGTVWEHYDVPFAPYFVYISGPAGRVMGEGVAAGWSEVRTLVANAVADGTTAATAGDPSGPAAPGGRSRSRADRERDATVDRQLAAAGIQPGDPRLYPESIEGEIPGQ